MVVNETQREYQHWSKNLSLKSLTQQLFDLGCSEVLIKNLSPNDNTKNQIYLGPDFSNVAKIPTGLITLKRGTSQKPKSGKPIYQALINFFWISPDGVMAAPHCKLIYYPQYPEVRLSGFLRGCSRAPNYLLSENSLRGREEGRILTLGISSSDNSVYGAVFSKEHRIVDEINSERTENYGVLKVLMIDKGLPNFTKHPDYDSKTELLERLCRISSKGAIAGWNLKSDGRVLETNAPNAGGLTLEAELGIPENPDNRPDFKGWEVKSTSVKSSEISMISGQPDGGLIIDDFEKFMIVYTDEIDKGKYKERYYTGRLRVGDEMKKGRQLIHERKLGFLRVVDENDHVLAEWSHEYLLNYWKKKHENGVHIGVKRQDKVTELGKRALFTFYPDVEVGSGSTFGLFLNQIDDGNISYDPACWIRQYPNSGKPKKKQRNNLRIRKKAYRNLYHNFELINTCSGEIMESSNRVGI